MRYKNKYLKHLIQLKLKLVSFNLNILIKVQTTLSTVGWQADIDHFGD